MGTSVGYFFFIVEGPMVLAMLEMEQVFLLSIPKWETMRSLAAWGLVGSGGDVGQLAPNNTRVSLVSRVITGLVTVCCVPVCSVVIVFV